MKKCGGVGPVCVYVYVGIEETVEKIGIWQELWLFKASTAGWFLARLFRA
jgi:hypothetical protein